MSKTIGALLASTSLAGANLFEIEQDGVSKRATLDQLRALLLPDGIPDLTGLLGRMDDAEAAQSALTEIYGTTLSAADFAAAADAARVAAVAARGQAETNASAALAARDTALNAADNAIAQINFLGDDGVLSRFEKIGVLIPQNRRLQATYDNLSDLAVAYGVVTELDAADDAWTAWTTFRDAITPDWDDISTHSTVDRDTMRDTLAALEAALSTLADAIAEAQIIDLAGLNTALVYIFKRSASTPSLPSATVTYTFATNGITGLNNGWSASVPAADGNPLYVSVATASGTGSTDTIGSGEWASAVILAQDGATGATGSTGAAGANAATVFLYQRATSTPSVPGTTTTYTFATGVLSGTLGSWSQSVPVGTDPLYIITASAIGTGSTDTIATGEWSSPAILAQNGATGPAGSNTALAFIFKRASSTPSLPSATVTFTFATGGMTGLNNGWSATVPAADGNPLYVSVATASGTGSTDTIGSGEWATPVILSQDGATGATGSAGAAGSNAATVFLYQRASSTPSVPGSTTTYTFATGVLSGTLGSWSQSVPAGSNPLYVTTATALGTGSTDTIATGEWATPAVMAQDGATGATGATGAAGLNQNVVLLYQRGATAPALPSGSAATYTFATGAVTGGTLNGWTTAIPAADGNPLWVIAQLASSNTTTASLTAGGWSAAVLKDGANVSVRVVTLYQRVATNSAPSVPSGTLTYTFATGALSGTLGSWTTEPPALTAGAYLFATFAVALGTGATDTIATGEWSTPQVFSAQDFAVITGTGRPEDNAQSGDNLVRLDQFFANGSFNVNGVSNFLVGDAGMTASALTTSDPAPYAILWPSGVTTGNAYCYVMFDVALMPKVVSRTVYASFDFFANSLATSFQVVAVCLDKSGADTGVYPASTTAIPSSASWQTVDFGPITLPANATTFRFYFQRTGANSATQKATKFRVGFTQRAADVTADAQVMPTPALDQTVYYDYTGTAKTGQLTRVLTNYLKKAGVDVSSAASWSFTPSGCTITAGSNGNVTLNTVTATNASIFVSATYAGKVYTWTIKIDRVQDNPPSGGTTATSFTSGVAGTPNSTVYTTPVVIASGTMLSNASGQVRLSITADYQAAAGVSASINGKWQKSLAGANSWSDTGISGTGSTSVGPSGALDDFGTTGSVTTGSTMVTGLTASTAYDFRFIAIYVGASMSVSGSAAGAQS